MTESERALLLTIAEAVKWKAGEMDRFMIELYYEAIVKEAKEEPMNA